jgi:hypothetical protein
MCPERGQPPRHPQRDVQRMAPRESSAPQMRNTAAALRRPTRASTRPAPRTEPKPELPTRTSPAERRSDAAHHALELALI